MNTTTTDETPTLVRTSPHYLEIVGITCGCGGRMLVEDWHPKGVRGEYRYELFCETCQQCDPNGWARQNQLIQAAIEFSGMQPKDVKAMAACGLIQLRGCAWVACRLRKKTTCVSCGSPVDGQAYRPLSEWHGVKRFHRLCLKCGGTK